MTFFIDGVFTIYVYFNDWTKEENKIYSHIHIRRTWSVTEVFLSIFTVQLHCTCAIGFLSVRLRLFSFAFSYSLVSSNQLRRSITIQYSSRALPATDWHDFLELNCRLSLRFRLFGKCSGWSLVIHCMYGDNCRQLRTWVPYCQSEITIER